MCFLGIDAGQSHIEVVLYENGKITFNGKGGPSHVQGYDMEQVFTKSLKQAIVDLPHKEKIYAIGAGISGIGILGKREAVERSIKKLFPASRIYLENDAVIGFWGASLGNDGASVIAGTGSIAYGKFRDKTCKVGGYGYLFGEAGGSWIGLQAIRRALHASENREKSTSIIKIIEDHYNVSSIRNVTGIIYSKTSVDVQTIAGLAKKIIEASVYGDTVAYEIVKESGKNIANLSIALLNNLNMPKDEPIPIYRIGNIWATDSVFISESEKIVKQIYPNARWKRPYGGSAIGAAIMAKTKYNKQIVTEPPHR